MNKIINKRFSEHVAVVQAAMEHLPEGIAAAGSRRRENRAENEDTQPSVQVPCPLLDVAAQT